MKQKTDLEHFLQLRLSKEAVARIDYAIATHPALHGFSRCRFIRAAVRFAFASLANEHQTDSVKSTSPARPSISGVGAEAAG